MHKAQKIGVPKSSSDLLNSSGFHGDVRVCVSHSLTVHQETNERKLWQRALISIN